jgi:hypothetical protein
MSGFREDDSGDLIGEIERYLGAQPAYDQFAAIAGRLEDSFVRDRQDANQKLRERCGQFLTAFCLLNPRFNSPRFSQWLDKQCSETGILYGDSLPFPGATWLDNYIISFQDMAAALKDPADKEELAADKMAEAAMIAADFGQKGHWLLSMLDVAVPVAPRVTHMNLKHIEDECIRLNGRGPEQERLYASFMICKETDVVGLLTKHFSLGGFQPGQQEVVARSMYYYTGTVMRRVISEPPQELLTLPGLRRADRKDNAEKRFFLGQAWDALIAGGNGPDDASFTVSQLTSRAIHLINQRVE